MTLRRTLVFAVAVALAGSPLASAAARHAPRERASARPIVFEAPAGAAPAGPTSRNDAFARILPSGRYLQPTGTSVVTGMNALGFALTPDGRFAIVSNDDERQSGTTSALDGASTGGYTLAVIDTQSMTVVSRYAATGESFFVGVAATSDPATPGGTLVLASGGSSNAVYAFDLDGAGRLTPDAKHVIPIPTPTDPRFADAGHAFPATIVLDPGGALAYVVDNLGDDVATIDLGSRSVARATVAVGFFPLAAAMSGAGLLVANEGLMRYGTLAAPATAPPFGSPPVDLTRASSLSVLARSSAGLVARPAVPLDRGPDGSREIGGAHPSAVVAMRTKPYAFVALGNVDRIATIALHGAGRAVGGTELRLFDRGPYGTQPDALALSKDERRLYVALAGIDAIAVLDVRDPLHPHRIGLIPTGWFPSALALARDGRYLFVTNAKGLGHDRGFAGARPLVVDAKHHVEAVEEDSNAIWATLERIDLAKIDLKRTTPLALSYLRTIRTPAPEAVVPQRFGGRGSDEIKHVVLILEENKTYDAMLGDLKDATGRPYGPGDPEYVAFDETVTPNLHALANAFALAGNIYADGEESDAGHQFVSAGTTSVYSEKTLLVKRGRRPLVNKNEDPEDYPRAGYLFNDLARHGKSYRYYGDYLRVSGYDEGEAVDPKSDDPRFVSADDTSAPTTGLGGLYDLDVPAPAALAGHVDLSYPGWNLRIRDVRRANEFERDFDPLVRADAMPAFTHIWLPADHGGFGKNIPPLAEEVADGDRALGQIVEYLTHIPQWKSTAIFIMPDDAQSSRDHVNVRRTYALVVSPFAKRHFIGSRHLSTVSVLKTEEELLGLSALSLGDALATDMSDFFTTRPDDTPYARTVARVQGESPEGHRIAALLARTDQSAPDADGVHAGRLVDLSRRADALAARAGAFAPAEYARRQGALFAAAVATFRTPR
ncbi:MAG: alkaline phosphatase family protein [Vulcanimicrobiaceae bacterium]